MTPRSFGALLKTRRQELELTLDQVAYGCGVSPQFIHKIETGLSVFPAEHIPALARTLRMDPDILIVEYVVPLMDRIYRRAGMAAPTWRVVPADLLAAL